MSDRLDAFDFTNATYGEPSTVLVVNDILAHLEQVRDVQGRQFFASIVRHHDEPRTIQDTDLPQLRVTLNESRYDNPTVQFHPVEGSAVIDFWIIYYAGDSLAHEQQRERMVRFLIRSLSDPGDPYNPDDTSTVYSQPDASAAGFGFHPRYTIWEFEAPQRIVASHTARAPFTLGVGMKATRLSVGVYYLNNVNTES